MSEILVNTIKKADGTGSLTVPAETGTVLTSGGAIDVNASAPADSVAIDASGKVGIGTTSPDGLLTIDTSTNTNADTMYILRGSGNSLPASIDTQTALLVQNRSDTFSTNISIIADDAGASTVNFGDQSDENAGGINYLHDVNAMRFKTNGNTERMRLDSDGALLIGATSQNRENCNFQINNRGAGLSTGVTNSDYTTDYNAFTFYRASASSSGSIRVGGSSVSYNTSSDYRLKENVVDMTGAITRVKSLSPKRFNFIADDSTTVDGFLAHEAQSVVPEAVTGTHDEVDDDGNAVMQGIDQSKLVPLLTGALQEAIAKIETLETTVADLQTRVTALEGA